METHTWKHTHMGDIETLAWKCSLIMQSDLTWKHTWVTRKHMETQPHYTGRHDNETRGDMETYTGDKETLAWKHGLITQGDITWKHKHTW